MQNPSQHAAPTDRGQRFGRIVLWGQGLYYFITGVWPILSIETFQMVTGRKTDHLVTGREGDHWLVMTVAALILAISLPLLLAAWRKTLPAEVILLAVGSSIALTTIDIVYVARHVLSPIYLADAAAEVVLIVLWAIVVALGRRGRLQPHH